MILGVGIDIVEVGRFASWASYPQSELHVLFSEREIVEMSCLSSYERKVEFCASRFACKEAFFKAFSASLVTLGICDISFSFAFARTHVEVVKTTWDVPILQVQWRAFEEKIEKKLPALRLNLSLSHEKTIACASVIISNEISAL